MKPLQNALKKWSNALRWLVKMPDDRVIAFAC